MIALLTLSGMMMKMSKRRKLIPESSFGYQCDVQTTTQRVVLKSIKTWMNSKEDMSFVALVSFLLKMQKRLLKVPAEKVLITTHSALSLKAECHCL